MASIKALLAEAQKKLVNTDTRNRLIHVNRSRKGANVVNVVNERSDDVFTILRVKLNSMRFRATGDLDDESDSEITFSSQPQINENEYTDRILTTPLTPDSLQKRLLKIASAAKIAEQEQGANILYLNLGFLHWRDDKNPELVREAPLILLPVELIRNKRTSTFDIRCRDDEIVTNLPLQERLKQDFGITLPVVDENEDWRPSEYFQKLRAVISQEKEWDVDENGIQLGFFSFAKLLMLRDLDPMNWSAGFLVNQPLIKGLLAKGFEPTDPLFGKKTNLDEVLEPNQLIHIVDADSSQTRVIEEVRAGRSLVVQGPPGTGKSQTIANILASAVHDGKTVLFVAEKMAALNVVQQKLVKSGLRDICLELHSKKATKKEFLAELAITLANSNSKSDPEDDTAELKRLRNLLNDMSSTMHRATGTVAVSPFDVLSSLIQFAGAGVPAPSISIGHLAHLSPEDTAKICSIIEKFCTIRKKIGSEEIQPFRGSQQLTLQPTDLSRLVGQLVELERYLRQLTELRDSLAEQFHIERADSIRAVKDQLGILETLLAPPTADESLMEICHQNSGNPRFMQSLEMAREWVAEKRLIAEIFNDFALIQPVTHLRSALMKGSQSWLSRLFGKYRSASDEMQTLLKINLPSSPHERLDVLDRLIAAQDQLRIFNEESSYLASVLKEHWRTERTSFDDCLDVARWMLSNNSYLISLPFDQLIMLTKTENLREYSGEVIGSIISRIEELTAVVGNSLQNEEILKLVKNPTRIEDLLDRVKAMSEHPETYDSWVSYTNAKDELSKFDLADLIILIERAIDSSIAVSEFVYALNEERWKLLLKERTDLVEISKIDRHHLVDEFQKLDLTRVKSVSKVILNRHLSQVPQGAVGEMGLIRGEIAKKRRHRPIRYMIEHAGSVVQRIKPIFLMSPISVAQFIPPSTLNFDLLVIDEASQVRPEDALGSIARANQIVVVGDQKQLPPTSFFNRLTDDLDSTDEDLDATVPVTKAVEMESVLSLCEARGLGQCMLEWHYRSRDPSLIAISNQEFYRNELVMPPSPAAGDCAFGLKLNRVPGVYSSKQKGDGRAGTNRIEAEHTVARLAELARTWRSFSAGIVTFSKAQAEIMEEVLELKRREDPVLDDFLAESQTENVFVKNIENVQGDERDIILISVAYGPHEANSKLSSMNFGPINIEGGERRLNVLFTRARIACEVFTSFCPQDIDTTKTKKDGPKILKRFLEYADTRNYPEQSEAELTSQCQVEADIALAVRSMGYEVDHQVGTGDFKVSLGVKNPSKDGHHILAIECDGAAYHNAQWARERDRLRQQVLEGFGWTFHRIWTLDWFYRKSNELEKLQAVLTKAAQKDFTLSLSGANNSSPIRVDQELEPPDESTLNLEPQEISVDLYKKADVAGKVAFTSHELSPEDAINLVREVVLVEGPIHSDEVTRRYASALGKSRAGKKIQDVVLKSLNVLTDNRDITEVESFFGTLEQFSNPPIRNRGSESSTTIKPQYISSAEINACATLILDQSGDVPLAELTKTIAKVLGFKRAGPDFQERVANVLKPEKLT